MTERIPPGVKGFSPFIDLMGLNFTKCEDGHSQCLLEVKAQLLNAQKMLHGAVTYAMADSGMGLALYSCIGDDEAIATIETNIVYFRSVTSGVLTCDAKVIHRSRRIATAEAEITNEGRPVAKALGTFSILKRKKGGA